MPVDQYDSCLQWTENLIKALNQKKTEGNSTAISAIEKTLLQLLSTIESILSKPQDERSPEDRIRLQRLLSFPQLFTVEKQIQNPSSPKEDIADYLIRRYRDPNYSLASSHPNLQEAISAHGETDECFTAIQAKKLELALTLSQAKPSAALDPKCSDLSKEIIILQKKISSLKEKGADQLLSRNISDLTSDEKILRVQFSNLSLRCDKKTKLNDQLSSLKGLCDDFEKAENDSLKTVLFDRIRREMPPDQLPSLETFERSIEAQNTEIDHMRGQVAQGIEYLIQMITAKRDQRPKEEGTDSKRGIYEREILTLTKLQKTLRLQSPAQLTLSGMLQTNLDCSRTLLSAIDSAAAIAETLESKIGNQKKSTPMGSLWKFIKDAVLGLFIRKKPPIAEIYRDPSKPSYAEQHQSAHTVIKRLKGIVADMKQEVTEQLKKPKREGTPKQRPPFNAPRLS